MKKEKTRLHIMIGNAIGESLQVNPRDMPDAYHLAKISTTKLVQNVCKAFLREDKEFDQVEFENQIKTTYYYLRKKELDRLERIKRGLAGATP
jgi:hypothetical protein|tara:strand:- start:1117 stop:1395 length:279 start_codon:yes stop_codon:yes gene_type:complete